MLFNFSGTVFRPRLQLFIAIFFMLFSFFSHFFVIYLRDIFINALFIDIAISINIDICFLIYAGYIFFIF